MFQLFLKSNVPKNNDDSNFLTTKRKNTPKIYTIVYLLKINYAAKRSVYPRRCRPVRDGQKRYLHLHIQ